ncbi:hypothetical protein GN958_ATG08203 [Phytophthora infestans]|uniref:Uncharacterized protein n=1 Tax=Phytophthora infestans TaxID=4787 RepID=A0A8S9UTG7_PHYIN|nr:hypothetical protein GN958_ATG08203 [Phytophthora infestans]
MENIGLFFFYQIENVLLRLRVQAFTPESATPSANLSMARKHSATPPRSHHFELRSRRLSRIATTVGDAPPPQVGIVAQRARPVDPILLIMWHLNILRLSVDAASHLDVANNVPPHWMSAQPPNIIMTTFTRDLCYNLR